MTAKLSDSGGHGVAEADWPLGEDGMARRVRLHDWARTPLGPVAGWPQSLRTAVDIMLAMPGPATILWGRTHVQIYNDAYVAIARNRHPALLGRPVAEGWPDAYDAVITPLLASARAGRATRLTAFPVRLRGPDGRFEERLFDTSWSPVRDEAGAVAGVLQTLSETTDRLRAQTAMRESEARHRLLIGSWAQAVWEAGPDGVVIADSPSWRAYTGQTVEEWLGYGWLDAIHPHDRAHAERQWREAIATRGLVDDEFRLRAPDGGWRWTNVRAAPVLDDQGTIEKWAGMNIDIDDRKRAEAALRESEEKYRLLFEFMDEAYAVVEVLSDDAGIWTDFRFLDANPAFMKHTSMPYPVGRTATELLGAPNPRWTELYGQALDSDEPIRVEEGEHVLGRTFDLNIFTLDRARNRVAILFTDITARKAAEAALRGSENQLRVITDATPALISYMDAQVRYRFSNQRYEEWFGRAPAEIHGRHARELLGDAAFERLRPHAEAALAGRRQVFEGEIPFERGGTRHVHTEFVPDVRADGTVAGFYSLVVDITDRKRMEEALRESEERLRGFGDASQDILWIRDAETLDWTYLTPVFEAIYGLTRREALQGDSFRNWLEMVVPEDRALAKDMTDRVLAGEQVIFEYRIRRPRDGEIRWLRDTDFPMRDEHGRIVSFGGIGQDVTSLKAAEEDLRSSEARLRSAAEVAKFALWDWTIPTGEITWSDAHFHMEGYAVGDVELSYEAWAARIHPDDRAGTEAALFHARDTRTEYVHEFRSVDPDGSIHWLSGRGRFFYDDAGAPVRMIGAMLEITERREWEERQKVLIAELQHRTRNLMGVVRSMSDKTARASADLPDFRLRFRDRLEALSRVQGLLSRLNEHDRVTFDDLIRTELSAMNGSSERVTLEGPSGIRLRSSTVQTLAMALHELATNAVKYGALGQSSGRLSVRWALEPSDDDGAPWLHIDWRESGVAMPFGTAPQGTGQGRELIERALPYQLSARTSYILGIDGVRCTISIPVSASNEEMPDDV